MTDMKMQDMKLQDKKDIAFKYRVGQKVSYCTLSIFLLNIDQFLQFFYQWTLLEICYSGACTPYLLRCYTTL